MSQTSTPKENISPRCMREILFEHLTLDHKGNLPNLIGLFDEKTWDGVLQNPESASFLLAPLLLLNSKEKYDCLIGNLLKTKSQQEINDMVFYELREAMELASHCQRHVSAKTIEDVIKLMDDEYQLASTYKNILDEERFDMVPLCHMLHPSLKTQFPSSALHDYQIFGEACLKLSRSKKTWDEKASILKSWSQQGVNLNAKPSTCSTHLLNLNWGEYDIEVVKKLFEAGINPQVPVKHPHSGLEEMSALDKILQKPRNDTIKQQMVLWQNFLVKKDIQYQMSHSLDKAQASPSKKM